MRFLRSFLLPLSLLATSVVAQDEANSQAAPKETHNYQSDVARMRKIVINSLYSHKEIFLRELISNANDAIEKLRLTALKDKSVWSGEEPLNITIKAVKNEDGPGGKLIISDTGIGMTPEELKNNLGTLAKSGTTEFLARAEGQDASGQGNLIGAFGLGFYSSFLVADEVVVASITPKTSKNTKPVQTIFRSSADDSSFEIFADPRGNTLGRGTEITLHLKEDATEYLDEQALTSLVSKHSAYSSSFPIYLYTQRTEQVPDTDAIPQPSETPSAEASEELDDDEAIVEEVSTEEEEKGEPEQVPLKDIVVEEWAHLNSQAPLWQRDSKEISEEEYETFYKAFFKEYEAPLAWDHFSGDSGSGVSFKAIVFLPKTIPESFWQQPLQFKADGIKLLVKRTFITSDLGEDALPKWAGWVRVVVDAEDLPLNVSRETLQSNKFLRQIRSIVLKHLISMFSRLAEEDQDKFQDFYKTYGALLKLGAVEDTKNRDKLAALARFTTNQRELVTLDSYVENRKQGQKQIFYLSEMGKSVEHLAKSVFVEKLHARGYEVLLLNEPLDEIFVQNVRRWKNVKFQDIAKAGLKFGDEEIDEAEEKKELDAYTEEYKPLLDWLKAEASNAVRDVVISNRLVTSPVAIVADSHGYTANMQRMMSASNSKKKEDLMHEYAMRARKLEINPRSPLIQGLLKRVQRLPSAEEEKDEEAEAELKEVASILIDGALVRSGFEVPDSNEFFARVDRVLRRSLGVSETAPTDDTVKPAPPVDPEAPTEEEPDPILDFGDVPYTPPAADKPGIQLPDNLKDKLSVELEEIDENDEPVAKHDEL